jgi:putative membrane protein
MTPSLPAWQFDPLTLLGAALLLLAYVLLYRRGATDRPRTPWPAWRAAVFSGGVLIVLLALLSPLDGLAGVLFWAHMLQHMALLVLAPPLLLLGLPVQALLRAVPHGFRRRVLRPLARNRTLHHVGAWLVQPVTVFCLFNGVLGLWHVPSVFAAADQTPALHLLEHGSFLAVGCLLWWLIVEPLRVWPSGAGLSKIVFVIGCHVPMLLLGQFFLAFAAIPLYAFRPAAEAAWGLTPLTDQRFGGGIMFGLDMLITFTSVSVLFSRYLARVEQRQLALDEILAARREGG